MIRWPVHFHSIAAKLNALGVMVLFAMLVMAAAAIYFATATGQAAHHLYRTGLFGVVEAGELELLLERHRRIIEAAPVEFDRIKIDKDRRDTEAIADRMVALANQRHEYYLNSISELLPEFVDTGRRVLFLAANFAQDRAMEAVEEYKARAYQVEIQIRRFRQNRLDIADKDVIELLASGRALTEWVILSALVGVFVFGPLSFFMVRQISTRLNAITETMLRLARNDTRVTIPSRDATDEVGAMARAVEVFKANAIALLDQRKELEQLNFRVDVAFNNMARGLSMFDVDERLVICNDNFRALYALPQKLSQPGTRIEDIFAHRRNLGRVTEGVDETEVGSWQSTYRTLLAEGHRFDVTYEMTCGRIILITYQPLPQGGCVAVHEDVTEKRAAEEKITRLAQRDTLTGIANRYHFRETLKAAFVGLGRKHGFAVHMIDLDRFKDVNDTLGHPTGDALLKEVASRLSVVVRGSDFVARLGGDEFAILQRDVSTASEAEAAATRILGALNTPYFINGNQLDVGASLGVAIAPDHATSHDQLLKKADIALYRAKENGRGSLCLFEPDFERKLNDRRALEVDLAAAMVNGELDLVYQPIVDLKTRRVVSCEALMRWAHPTRGAVSPTEFIPVAEAMGVISELGAWALHRACQDAARWPDDVGVSVNLSAAQFDHADLVEIVHGALSQAGIAPGRLILEVTESLLLKNTGSTRETLHGLRADGVQIALDDFGTGYASLSYLRSFPFDKIKIDQSFVRDPANGEQSVEIVRAVAELARTFGMKTVAEGVETQHHLSSVIDAGCDEVQGYLFSRPVPRSELMAALARCRTQLLAAA